MGSFWTPLSGLLAAQNQLQSVSNNLANMGTDGYKDQTLTFGDLFSQASTTNGAGNPLQTGFGVQEASTAYDFSEGSLNSTNIPSNMAMYGNGFFVTQGASGGLDYTRAGDFTTNNSGQLIAPGGQLVMGYPAVGGVASPTSALQPMQISYATSPAVASTSMQITANLNSSAAVGDTATSSLPVYDSLGTAHNLSVTYTKTAANTWSYSVTMPSADLTPPGSGTTTAVASGTMNFSSSGVLTSTQATGAATTSAPSAGIAISLPPTGTTLADGAAPMSLNWGLDDASGNTTISQTASASATSATSTNGFASGTLSSYTVQSDGTIEGTFTSGATEALGQVAVASFANTQGLVNAGGNNYQASAASGAAVVGVAGTGGRGTVVGGAVESSNVDIATEFAKMISAQQDYSANAKSITTLSALSQAVLAMVQ